MNKVFKVLSVLSICCLSLLIAPFHISANEELPEPFIGVNVYVEDAEYYGPYGNVFVYKVGDNYRIENKGTNFVSAYPVWHYDLVLDSNYVGSVTVTYTITSDTNSQTYYVNGNHLQFNLIGNASVITLSNVNLNNIGSGNNWAFPIESFSVVSFALKNLQLSGITQYDNYIYPIFSVKSGDTLFQTYLQPGQTFEMIFYASFLAPNISQMLQRIDFGGLTLDSIQPIALVINNNQGSGRFYRLIVSGGNSDNYNISAKRSFDFMPIFGARDIDPIRNYLSTDFALRWGLSNSLLDNLNILANGTTSSNQSSDNLNDKTGDLNTSSNQLVTQEDNFNNDMNSALQNIDTNFNVGTNFGSKFIASADWVKTQYDRLTGNTPFGSVISFSLLIGLALLLVGKVFK